MRRTCLLSLLLVIPACSSGDFAIGAGTDSATGDDAASTEDTSSSTDGLAEPDGDSFGPDAAPVDTAVETPSSCITTKTPSEDACVLRDDLGVFVSSTRGVDGAAGTRTAPVKTIANAIALAATRSVRVYACDDVFPESVTLVNGVNIFGGIDCVTWKVSTKKTVISPPEGVPIVANNLTTTVRIEGVQAVAKDAPLPGGSSIAMIANNASVVLTNVDLLAGAAAAGAAGAPGTTGTSGDVGVNGSDPVSTGVCGGYYEKRAVGGAGGVNARNGGKGGNGQGCVIGTLGGTDGAGATTTCGRGAPTLTASCRDGQAGCVGTPGIAGAKGTGIGTLSLGGYTTPVRAGRGTDGGAGGGGGGGGGGGTRIDGGGTSQTGGAGGGGGGGGYGGGGGEGGAAGGASIALVSIYSNVVLNKSRLVAKNGGNGGAGGASGAPGSGGVGGGGGASGSCVTTPTGYTCNSMPGCDGGVGGSGGAGGHGGGGVGGPSLGVAYKGTAPVVDPVTTIAVGAAGAGGPAPNTGDPGVAAPQRAF